MYEILCSYKILFILVQLALGRQGTSPNSQASFVLNRGFFLFLSLWGYKGGYKLVLVMDLLLNMGGMRFLSINGKILCSLRGSKY